MARDLSTLARSMRSRAQGLDELGNQIKREGVEAMLREMVSVTPVDTSEAISGWQVGAGVKPVAILPPHFAGRRGSTRGASSDKSIDEGLSELTLAQPGKPVYLSNTARHIGDLDRGTSVQFAGGFVPRALIVFRLAAKAAMKRLWK